MKTWITLIVCSSLLIISACSESKDETEEQTPEGMLNSIKEMDDSLKVLVEKRMSIDTFVIDKIVYHEAINRNKAFYKEYPEHEKAEKSLEKIASMYLQIGVDSEAAKWRDSILINYPENENKIGILEMQMNYYDFDNYNPDKIKYYTEKLLAIETLPEGKREDYEFRLQHLDKTFDELIMIRMQENDSVSEVKVENI